MPEFTYTLPAGGEARNLSDALIKTALTKLKEPTLDNTNLSASAGIKGTQLSASAAIADTQLASPNSAAYRTIFRAHAPITQDLGAGTYSLLSQSGASAGTSNPLVSGGNAIETGITQRLPAIIYFDDTDYTVAGKTQKLRLRAQIAVNATKAAIKFTIGMYPVTVAGGTDVLSVTLGTVVAGSAVEINEPAASSVTQAAGSEFTIPADGAYALGVVTSGTLTNNSATLLSADLQTHSV